MDFKNFIKKFDKYISKIVKYGVLIISIETILLVLLRCPFALPFLACDLCPIVDCPSKYYRNYFVMFIVGYMAVFRKDFCSKICPVGTINDLLYKFRRIISKKTIKITPDLKTVLMFLKYSVFLFAILAIIYGNPRYYIPIHTSDLITSIKLSYLSANSPYFIRLYSLIIALLLGLIIYRFWCRFLCPLGTGITLTKKTFKNLKNININENCKKCSKCGKNGNNNNNNNYDK